MSMESICPFSRSIMDFKMLEYFYVFELGLYLEEETMDNTIEL